MKNIKNIKKFKACLFILLFIVLFCFTANIVFALEVKYPTIREQTITQDTELPKYLKYVFDFGILVGFAGVFISLVIAGIQYLFSPFNANSQASAKDRIGGAISGLLILALLYLIMTTINPALTIFRLNSLPEVPTPPPDTDQAPGLYLYKSTGCSDDENAAHIINSTNNLDNINIDNKAVSGKIVHDVDSQVYYISVIYDHSDFWGRCFYINPNNTNNPNNPASDCQNTINPLTNSPYASSASVYQYDFNPNGDGVYFYRKSFFNPQGGQLKISNSQINGIYEGYLSDLFFEDVPEEEKDCIRYDQNNICIEKKNPTLAGENISSIRIKGDYIVLLVYIGPNETWEGPWYSCQSFPTQDDVNKTGPQQIKWRPIRNNEGVIPNYILIMPVIQN